VDSLVVGALLLAVDKILLAGLLAIGAAAIVVLALAFAASLRGPPMPRTSRRPVESLVTEAIPEEPGDDEDEDGSYQADADSADSPPRSG
jgi:hypothetical protein